MRKPHFWTLPLVPSVTTPTLLLEPLPLCLSHGCKVAICVDEFGWVCLHQNQLLWLPSPGVTMNWVLGAWATPTGTML